MKKLLAILLIAFMIVSLTACAVGAKENAEPTATGAAAEEEAAEQSGAGVPGDTVSDGTTAPAQEAPQMSGDLALFDNMRDACAYAGIASISLPENYPEGYRQTSTFGAIEGRMVETSFTDGSGTITIRKGLNMEDVYGDDTVYPENKTVTANEMEIGLEGKDGVIYLALWSSEGYAYAIQFSAGIDEATAAEMAGSTV